MANEDTLNLLKETNSGLKMAVSSIDEVLDKVQDQRLKDILVNSKKDHETLGDETHKLILSLNDKDKEPNPIAKAMSWMKINAKMLMDKSDHEVATLMSEGCNMGINSLRGYMSKYDTAEEQAVSLANRLIDIEESLDRKLQPYMQ